MSKRILILSANPEGTSSLDLDTEKREIRQALKGSDYIIETRGAVRPGDLQQALLEVQPQIVHFCGHGEGTDGIVLVNDEGNIEFASTAALAKLFEIFQENIECIILNACYTEVQATAISQHINYVIGMNRSILDESAIIFARGFYGAIGAKNISPEKKIETTYELGKVAISLEYPDKETIQRKLVPVLEEGESREVLPENLIPVLKTKPNPTPIKIVDSQANKDQLRSLIGHADSVEAIAFSNDSRYLVSGSKDRTVRLWETSTGKLLQLF